MKKIYTLFLTAFLFVGASFAQSTANYAFTTSTTGSLTNMSTGTTQLVAALSDDIASPVSPIGFDFWLMGVKYTQFSANSNGYVRLGGTAVPSANYTLGAASTLIAPFGSDEVTSTTGKVHYKITGVAPNRVLVIEFLNMTVIYDGGGATADATTQVRLSEGTGKIELAYGAVNRNTSTGFNGGMDPIYVGFSTSATAYATVTTSTGTVATSGAITSNQYTLGAPVAELTSAADGSRRLYTFVPPTPLAPSGLNLTAIGAVSMTLNWADNAVNEIGYLIYRSTDGVTYNLVSQLAANSTSSVQNGLTTNTTYYWRVSAITEGVESATSDANATTTAAGNITSNGTGGGLWSQATTWTGGIVPSSGDNVLILDGDAVTVDVASGAYSLTIGQGVSGTVQYEATTARTLSVLNNVTVSTGASFLTGGAALAHILSVGGNLSNNGILDFNIGTGGTNITFTGSANSVLNGTGTTTDLFSLTAAKTARAQIIEISPSVFSVRDLSAAATGALLTTATGTGTFKFTGTYTFSGTLWSAAAYSIPATLGLWIDNPNFTVNGLNGSATVAGLFRVSKGTYNIGTASGNSMGFSAGSVITVEGGAINAAGRFGVTAAATIFSYTQTAGTITVCTQGNVSTTLASFDLGTSATSTVNISGGTIICQLANTAATTPRDYRNQAGTGIVGVANATLQLGNAASGTSKLFIIQGVVPNLVVTNTSATHTATFFTPVTYNNVSQNITVNAGSTLNFGNFVFLFNGAVLTNNGTITHNGVSSNFVTFNTTIPQSYTGNGVVTVPMTNIAFQSPLGFTFDPSSTPIVASAVRLFNGNVFNSNKLIVGNGGTAAAFVQFGNNTTPTDAGTFDQPLNYNPGTGGISISYLRTTAARTTGIEIPVSRIVTNLTYDDNDATHALTIVGGDLTASGTLTMANGNIITGVNTLVSGTSVATPGTFTYTSGTIVGKFKRWITPTATAWNFPVGIATAKRNAAINFTAAPTTGGSLTTEWITAVSGTNGLPLTESAIPVTLNATSADGYWRVLAADGLAGGSYTGTFTGTGISAVGDYTQLVLVKRAVNTSPWTLDGTHVSATGSNAIPVVSRTGMTGFSEFTVAGDGVINVLPITISYFRGAKNGNANNLDWKVNVTNSSSINLTLERSADGRNFTALYNTTATDTRALQPFNYADASPLAVKNFYRLKMTETNGRITYSNIVVILNSTKGFEIVNLTPNYVTAGTFKLNVTTAQLTKMDVIITDALGRVVSKQIHTVVSGSNSINMNVNNLGAGTYYLYGNTSEGKTGTFSFIVQ